MYTAIWAYPWDFLEEGIDTVLARVADAGLEAVSMAAAYHTIRALCPHNPRRAVYHGEGGVVYFRPDASHFEGLRIRPVESDLLAEGDILERVCEAADRRGIRVHAWTVLHHNTRLGTAHPDASLENAFGDRYPFGLCPANPDVRAYTLALVRSLAGRPGLDTIELESLGYMGIDHSGHHSKQGVELDPAHRFLLSVCFCPHCRARMEANGVDAAATREAIVRRLRAFFVGQHPATSEEPLVVLEGILGRDPLEGILAARDEVVLTLLEELYWEVEAPQRLSVMVTGSPLATGAQAGITLSQARAWTDRFLTQVFARETEAIRSGVADITVRRGSIPVHAGLQVLPPYIRSAAELRERVAAVREAGADGVQFYHYGLMPLSTLEWIRDALATEG